MTSDTTSVAQKLAVWTAASIAGCWLIYFVYAPTVGFDWLESWHNEQRALQVVLLLCTALGYLWLLFVIPTVRVAGLLWVALALGAVSATVAALPIHAAAEISLSAQLLLLGAFFATLVRRFGRHSSSILLYSAWLIGAVYVVGVAAHYVGVVVEQRAVDLEVFVLGYANPRFASALHALILPLIAWLALDPSHKRSLRYSSWVIATLIGAINLALGTRAIWAAYFVSSIVLWYFYGQPGRRAVKAVTIPAVAGAIVYLTVLLLAPSALPDTGSMHSRVGDLGTSSLRLDLWKTAIESTLAHPWLGIGPMHFAKLHAAAGAHPHNWLLQLSSEWGLPAMAVVLLVIFRWMRALRAALTSRADTVKDDALPAVVLSVLTAIVYGLADGNWVMPISQSLAVILVGASVGLLPARETVPVRRVLRLQSGATIAAVLATGCALGWYTYRTVGLQLQREDEYVKATHMPYFLPRFWQQGILQEESAEHVSSRE